MNDELKKRIEAIEAYGFPIVTGDKVIDKLFMLSLVQFFEDISTIAKNSKKD